MPALIATDLSLEEFNKLKSNSSISSISSVNPLNKDLQDEDDILLAKMVNSFFFQNEYYFTALPIRATNPPYIEASVL